MQSVSNLYSSVFDATEGPFANELNHVVAEDTAVSSGGMTEIITLPITFYEELKNLGKAIRNFDAEGIIETSARLFSIPFGFAYAAQNLAIVVLTYLKAASLFLLNITSYITGRIFVAIEILIESGRLYLLHQFEKELDFGDLSKYKNNHTLLYNKLIEIRNRYFQLSNSEISEMINTERANMDYHDPLKGKLNSLARKLRPWLVKELKQELTPVIEGIRQDDPEKIARGVELLQLMKTQIDKTRRMYYIGLIALVIASVVFGLTIIITAPYVMPVIIGLAVVGTILEFGRWFAPASYLDSKDHRWNWDPWIPGFLKRKTPKITQNTRHQMVELVTISS